MDKLELYEELYKRVCDANKTNTKTKKIGELTICPAIPGEAYQSGGRMFVGRAINGWCSLKDSVRDDDIKKRIERCEKCTLGWVVGKNNWKNCKNNGCPYAQDGDRLDGRKNSTPFWQMIEYICKKTGEGKDWYKKIVWSNLYKASFTNGKNPSNFYNEQVGLCNDILIKEIELYQPSEIYFLTEPNVKKPTLNNRVWFCEEYTGKYYEKNTHFGAVYKYLRNKPEIKIFVLTRPEFQIKDQIYKEKQDLEGKTIEN